MPAATNQNKQPTETPAQTALRNLKAAMTPPSVVATTSTPIPTPTPTPETIAAMREVRPAVFSLRERTQMLVAHARENGEHLRFLGQRDVGWYSNMLEGVPFVIVSELTWRTQQSQFGPQEVAQAQVRLYDWASGRETESQLVTFQGTYLLNQLRAMTPNEIVGSYVFTVKRNAAMPLTPQGVHPRMLAVYDAEHDGPPPDTF